MTSSRAEWQSNCPNLGDIMSKARDRSLLTDVQFVIGQKPSTKTFHAHKMILACGSPVFEKMFYGPMPEKRNPIVIEEDDNEAFDMLLNFIYGKGDKIKLNSLVGAWKYYSIGDKYIVKEITEDAQQFIKLMCMTENDFWCLYENGLLTEEIFKLKISGYLAKNACEILKSDKFLTVPKSIVTDILQMDNVNVSEFELLKSIVKWGNCNFGNEGKDKKIMQLLKHVRFSVLDVGSFCTFTDNFPDAIDYRSCVSIIKHLLNKPRYKLPDWCTTKDYPRYTTDTKSRRISVIHTNAMRIKPH